MIDKAHAIASRPDVISLLRRHAARARLARRSAHAQEPRRRRARRLLAARRRHAWPRRIRSARSCSSRIGFETTAPANAMAVFAGQAAGRDELLHAGVARARAAGDGGHPAGARTTASRRSSDPATSAPSWATASTSDSRAVRVPIVITGFEPVDLLEGILLAVRQLEAGRAEVENQYARAVARDGNHVARDLICRGVRGRATATGAASARSRSRGTVCARRTARTTRSGCSRSRRSRPRSRRRASAA